MSKDRTTEIDPDKRHWYYDDTGVKRLKDNIDELLTITSEECAEVIVECSKIKRFCNPTDDFEKEVGDLLCLLFLCEKHNLINMDTVNKYSQEKLEKLKQYSNLLKE